MYQVLLFKSTRHLCKGSMGLGTLGLGDGGTWRHGDPGKLGLGGFVFVSLINK